MRIHLLRHGETTDNVAGRFSGAGDACLTDRGISQMKRAATRLSRADITHLCSSPSPRTCQSAGIVMPGMTPLLDNRLRERDMGLFEGLTHEQITRNFPQESAAWEKDWMAYEIPDGESYLKFYARVSDFWRELLLQQAESVLLSTHGGVLRASLCLVMGDPALFWKFACRNGDVAVVHHSFGNLYLSELWPGSTEMELDT